MQRITYIEQIRRMIYNGQPSDDATITPNLVNVWLNQAIALAAKQNYKDNIAIDGISFVNNSFYTSFSGIALTYDSKLLWKFLLPHLPFGIGANEGISTVQLTDDRGNITRPLIPLTENQRTIYQNVRDIPNKFICYYEGEYVFIPSTLLLNDYTAKVTMVSGGDASDLSSTLNVPDDFFPIMTDYIVKNLMVERNIPVDAVNDGTDLIQST